jgi:hypothetical protein
MDTVYEQKSHILVILHVPERYGTKREINETEGVGECEAAGLCPDTFTGSSQFAHSCSPLPLLLCFLQPGLSASERRCESYKDNPIDAFPNTRSRVS